MNINQIHIDKINFHKLIPYYNKNKLFINLPELNCPYAMEKYFNKYQIRLDLTEDVYHFLKSLEEYNKQFCQKNIGLFHNGQYKSNIIKYNDKYQLILKIPYRYKKFEVNVTSDRLTLPTIHDLKPDTKVKCKILITKLWSMKNDKEEYVNGCIMELKDINIL